MSDQPHAVADTIDVDGTQVDVSKALAAIGDILDGAPEDSELLYRLRQRVEHEFLRRCHPHFPDLGFLKQAQWEAQHRQRVLRCMRDYLQASVDDDDGPSSDDEVAAIPQRVDPDSHDAILAVCERFLRHCTWSEPVSEVLEIHGGAGWEAEIRVTVHRDPVATSKGGLLPYPKRNPKLFELQYKGRDRLQGKSDVTIWLSQGTCFDRDPHVDARWVSWDADGSSRETPVTIVRHLLTMLKRSGTLRFLLEEEGGLVAAAAATGGGAEQQGGVAGGAKRGRPVMNAMIARVLLGELLIFESFEEEDLNLVPGLCGVRGSKAFAHDDEKNQQLYDACPPPAPGAKA